MEKAKTSKPRGAFKGAKATKTIKPTKVRTAGRAENKPVAKFPQRPTGKASRYSPKTGTFRPSTRPSGRPDHAPRPLNFRQAFDAIWTKVFTSPVHLDSALSQAPPSQKSALAVMMRVILQRPSSLAHYLRFHLSEDEPWGLDRESLAEWPTARAMADRLFHAWKKDPYFADGGFPVPEDYPSWMIDEWRRDFGDKVAKDLVEGLGSPAPLSLRASRMKGRDEVLSALNDSNEIPIRARSSTVAPFAFFFPEYAAIMGHELFRTGAYEIQDEGSQVMSLFALWPEEFLPMLRKVPGPCRAWPREKEVPKGKDSLIVVDACAGAGGKTLAMADALRGRSQVFAYDVSAKKLDALKKRAKRAGLHNIKTVAVEENNETVVVSKFKGTADFVLVDAPCSGWGTLRRNPDVKWRQEYESLERLEILQARLLDAYAPLVKPGGALTFGVCTFRKTETADQVKAFLERNPDFVSVGGGYFGPGPSDAFFLHAFRRVKK
jgi:16S rRNA C967 or C1407 C5-methylase (RsmB/RsmF family)